MNHEIATALKSVVTMFPQLHGYNICSDLAGEVTCHSLKDKAETRFTCSIFPHQSVISLFCDLQSTCVAKMMVVSQKTTKKYLDYLYVLTTKMRLIFQRKSK